MIAPRPFPVLNPPPECPAAITWSSLSPEWAERNHRAGLVQLARRGGLSVTEIYANVRGIPLRKFGEIDPAAALDLVKRIAYADA